MLSTFFAKVRQRFAALAADAPVSRRALLAVPVLAVVGTIAVTQSARAESVGDFVALGLAWFLNILVGFVGQLLLIMVSALIWVAQYNGFVDSIAVVQGWTILRDITNMFFIVVMLVFAFGTILGVDNYSYKNKQLSRLLIMAVVVNFSRTICGVLIDASQVVMLTFVHGFKEAAGGNFADALRITKMMQIRTDIDPNGGDRISAWSIAVAMALALVMTVISLVTVLLMTVTLVVRIVYLWMLVVLSPLAFFASAVPGGKAKGYYGKWWEMFTSQVIIGPVMAFFLWLSLISVASPDFTTAGFPAPPTTGAGTAVVTGSMTEAFKDSEIQSFIIAICMLLGGLSMSKKIADNVGVAQNVGKKAQGYLGTGVSGAGRAFGVAGSAADSVSGGRFSRAKESVLAGASKMPRILGGGFAQDALISSRKEREKKAGEEAGRMKGLPKDVVASLATRGAWTEDQKITKKEALKKMMEGIAEKGPQSPADYKKFYEGRKELMGLGAFLKDEGVDKAIKDMETKRPSLIIDPDEKDPETVKKQQEAFRKAAGKLNGNKLSELAAEELTPALLMNASAKSLMEMQKNASGEQLARMQQHFGKPAGDDFTVEEIKARQAGMKNLPENFNMISDEERIGALKAMSADQLQALASNPAAGAALFGEGVMASLAKDGNAGMFADKVAGSLKPEQLSGNEALASQIADAISAGALKELPKEISKVLLPMVAQNDAGRALNGGASMEQAFKGYGAGGSFDTPTSRGALEAFLQGANAGKNAAAIPAGAVSANGGVNDVSIAMSKNLKVEDLTEMVASGNGKGASELLAAAQKLAAVDTNDQAAVDKFVIENKNVTYNEAELRQAMTDAAKLVASAAGKNNPVNAAAKEENIWKQAQKAEKAAKKAEDEAARTGRKVQNMERKLLNRNRKKR